MNSVKVLMLFVLLLFCGHSCIVTEIWEDWYTGSYCVFFEVFLILHYFGRQNG